MVKVDDKLLGYLMSLSHFHLKLDESRRNKLKKDLSAVLRYVSQLQELDTSQVEILQRPYPLKNIGHSDEVKSENYLPASVLPTEKVYKNYLVVKQLINKDGA